MTLKSFLSVKTPFFGMGVYFLYRYLLNFSIELWFGQIQWCRSMLSIGVGYFAIFSPFLTLRR